MRGSGVRASGGTLRHHPDLVCIWRYDTWPTTRSCRGNLTNEIDGITVSYCGFVKKLYVSGRVTGATPAHCSVLARTRPYKEGRSNTTKDGPCND